VVTVAVRTWLPFASVLSAGVTDPAKGGFPLNINVPVIGGLLKELVTVAVMTALSPRFKVVELTFNAPVVGYRTKTLPIATVAAA
jgi:hypothetical protein